MGCGASSLLSSEPAHVRQHRLKQEKLEKDKAKAAEERRKKAEAKQALERLEATSKVIDPSNIEEAPVLGTATAVHSRMHAQDGDTEPEPKPEAAAAAAPEAEEPEPEEAEEPEPEEAEEDETCGFCLEPKDQCECSAGPS